MSAPPVLERPTCSGPVKRMVKRVSGHASHSLLAGRSMRPSWAEWLVPEVFHCYVASRDRLYRFLARQETDLQYWFILSPGDIWDYPMLPISSPDILPERLAVIRGSLAPGNLSLPVDTFGHFVASNERFEATFSEFPIGRAAKDVLRIAFPEVRSNAPGKTGMEKMASLPVAVSHRFRPFEYQNMWRGLPDKRISAPEMPTAHSYGKLRSISEGFEVLSGASATERLAFSPDCLKHSFCIAIGARERITHVVPAPDLPATRILNEVHITSALSRAGAGRLAFTSFDRVPRNLVFRQIRYHMNIDVPPQRDSIYTPRVVSGQHPFSVLCRRSYMAVRRLRTLRLSAGFLRNPIVTRWSAPNPELLIPDIVWPPKTQPGWGRLGEATGFPALLFEALPAPFARISDPRNQPGCALESSETERFRLDLTLPAQKIISPPREHARPRLRTTTTEKRQREFRGEIATRTRLSPLPLVMRTRPHAQEFAAPSYSQPQIPGQTAMLLPPVRFIMLVFHGHPAPIIPAMPRRARESRRDEPNRRRSVTLLNKRLSSLREYRLTLADGVPELHEPFRWTFRRINARRTTFDMAFQRLSPVFSFPEAGPGAQVVRCLDSEISSTVSTIAFLSPHSCPALERLVFTASRLDFNPPCPPKNVVSPSSAATPIWEFAVREDIANPLPPFPFGFAAIRERIDPVILFASKPELSIKYPSPAAISRPGAILINCFLRHRSPTNLRFPRRWVFPQRSIFAIIDATMSWRDRISVDDKRALTPFQPPHPARFLPEVSGDALQVSLPVSSDDVGRNVALGFPAPMHNFTEKTYPSYRELSPVGISIAFEPQGCFDLCPDERIIVRSGIISLFAAPFVVGTAFEAAGQPWTLYPSEISAHDPDWAATVAPVHYMSGRKDFGGPGGPALPEQTRVVNFGGPGGPALPKRASVFTMFEGSMFSRGTADDFVARFRPLRFPWQPDFVRIRPLIDVFPDISEISELSLVESDLGEDIRLGELRLTADPPRAAPEDHKGNMLVAHGESPKFPPMMNLSPEALVQQGLEDVPVPGMSSPTLLAMCFPDIDGKPFEERLVFSVPSFNNVSKIHAANKTMPITQYTCALPDDHKERSFVRLTNEPLVNVASHRRSSCGPFHPPEEYYFPRFIIEPVHFSLLLPPGRANRVAMKSVSQRLVRIGRFRTSFVFSFGVVRSRLHEIRIDRKKPVETEFQLSQIKRPASFELPGTTLPEIAPVMRAIMPGQKFIVKSVLSGMFPQKNIFQNLDFMISHDRREAPLHPEHIELSRLLPMRRHEEARISLSGQPIFSNDSSGSGTAIRFPYPRPVVVGQRTDEFRPIHLPEWIEPEPVSRHLFSDIAFSIECD
ncbi:MAG: hypothetical protein HQM09_21685 [Candidatus Riflebacteria bacterium]|nr:hypothetical protein [Candidatus Riflebacteria bacterium]